MKDYKNAAVISEAFMNLPEVKAAKRKYGLVTSGLILEISLRMKHWKNGIGTFDDIRELGNDVKKYASTLLEWMRDTGIYQIDDENQLFYSRRQRFLINKTPDPTPEEIEDIKANGNIYKGTPRENRRRATGTGGSKSAAAVKTSKNRTINDKEITKNNSSEVQNTDNKQVSTSLIPNPSSNLSDIILLKNNNISKVPRTKQNKSCSQDLESTEKKEEVAEGENFNFFKEKIFSSKEWTDNISKIRNIELYDKETADIFAEWMYAYCIANRKMPHETEEIQGYAFRLLDKRHGTRKMFEEYLEKRKGEILEKKKEEEAKASGKEYASEDEAKKSYYKDTGYLNNGGCDYYEKGYRYAACNYDLPIPLYAVPQPNYELKWSYIYDDWIAPSKYNTELETEKFLSIKEEILAKRKVRAEKRQKIIHEHVEALWVCRQCEEKGIEVCSIYDGPKKHPNRKKKKYKNWRSDRQYRFQNHSKSEDDFYNDTRDI